jgi:REP element-mobilizing transposase RayT
MRVTEAGTFHVTSRGNAQEAIFRDCEDYLTFLRMVAAVIAQFGWKFEAYCLMPNHFHFVLDTPEPNLGRGMHRLKGRYARRFNVRHGRVGHVFQGPYDATPIRSDEQLLVCCRYVDLNPVRAGLCTDPAAWQWSSYRDTRASTRRRRS